MGLPSDKGNYLHNHYTKPTSSDVHINYYYLPTMEIVSKKKSPPPLHTHVLEQTRNVPAVSSVS